MNRDRVGEAEQLLRSHHYARPIVREIGSAMTPARRTPAAAWPGNRSVGSSGAERNSGDRGVVGRVDW